MTNTARTYSRAGFMRGIDDPDRGFKGGNPDWFPVLFPDGIDGVSVEAQTAWVLYMANTYALRVEVDLIAEARNVRAWIAAHPERAPTCASLAAYFAGWLDRVVLTHRASIAKHGPKPSGPERNGRRQGTS